MPKERINCIGIVEYPLDSSKMFFMKRFPAEKTHVIFLLPL